MLDLSKCFRRSVCGCGGEPQAGERTPLVKCMLHKREDPSLDPYPTRQKLGASVHCGVCASGNRREQSLRSYTAQLSLVSKVRVEQETSSQNHKVKSSGERHSGARIHRRIGTHTGAHAHTPPCRFFFTWLHKQIHTLRCPFSRSSMD